MKNKSYLKFFSYGNIGMQLGMCFGHLMFDLKLFLQFFKLDPALVPTTNQGLSALCDGQTIQHKRNEFLELHRIIIFKPY